MRNSPTHIKLLVGIFILMLSFGSFSQKKIEVERFWLSANHGFNLYNEVGAQIQLFDQFLIGGYFQNFRRNVGTGVPTNPNAIIFSGTKFKQDEIQSGSVMIGFASPTPHSVMLSFLVGPSLNKSATHSDFNVTYSSNGNYPVKVTSAVTERWKIGLNYKATLSFIIRNKLCINLGLAGNYNGVVNYNRFILGLGIGDFGSSSPAPKYRIVTKYDEEN